MRRDEFINNIWKRYPAMPVKPVAWGRLLQVVDDHLVLESGIEIKFETTMKDVLRVGDIVAITEHNGQNEVLLLAPRLEAPLQLSSSVELQNRYSDFIEGVKKFFKSQGFVESFTPTLVTCPGTEPYLDYFSTEFSAGKLNRKFYLPTSPEIHLKKLLGSGYSKVFEIKNCFRNGEVGTHHEPEFMMLEWYRSYATVEQIHLDLVNLIKALGGHIPEVKTVTMADLFKEHLNFDLTPKTSKEELRQALIAKGQNMSPEESIDDLFCRIVVDYIEPNLNPEIPTVIKNYPPFQAAYARLTEDGWADRFELFWKGLEIANAFHEVTDPDLQLERMHQDLQKKLSLQKEIPALDMEFIQVLRAGMPPSGGIALGVERLFMAMNNIQDMKDLKVFSMRRFL